MRTAAGSVSMAPLRRAPTRVAADPQPRTPGAGECADLGAGQPRSLLPARGTPLLLSPAPDGSAPVPARPTAAPTAQPVGGRPHGAVRTPRADRKSTRLNSSHSQISY